MDDFFKNRLQSLEVQPPKGAFKAIQKTLLRRKLTRYFLVIGTTMAVLAGMTLGWHQTMKPEQLIENQNITNTWSDASTSQAKLPRNKIQVAENQHIINDITAKNSVDNPIHLGEINQHIQKQNSTKSTAILTKTPQKLFGNLSKLGTNNVPKYVVLSENTQKSTYKIVSKKDKIQNLSDTLENLKMLKNTSDKLFLNPIAQKEPQTLTDSIDFVSDSLANRSFPQFEVPFRNPRFHYAFYVASEWRSGNKNVFQNQRLDMSTEEEFYAFSVPQSVLKPKYHFRQNILDLGVRMEYASSKRLRLFWVISMVQLQETYTKNYINYQASDLHFLDDSIALNLDNPTISSSPDSSNSYGILIRSKADEFQDIQENKFAYFTVNQGFGYDLLQGKSRTIRLNVEAGIGKLAQGISVHRSNQEEIYRQTNRFHGLFLSWRTGIELSQRLSENWDILGSTQFRGFWNQESAGGVLQGVQIGVRWR